MQQNFSEYLASLQVGDVVKRNLYGILMDFAITEINEVLIVCGPWDFDKVTGKEVDEDLSSSPSRLVWPTRVVYRVEHPATSYGMWHTYDEDKQPCVLRLSCPSASLPMPDSPSYRKHDKQWFSSGPDLATLLHWFDRPALQQLIAMGFQVYKLEVGEWQELPMEIIFTKESVKHIENITSTFLD